MQVTFMRVPIEKWLREQHGCQFIQRQWQGGKMLTKKVIALQKTNETLREIAKSNNPLKTNELLDFQADWLGLCVIGTTLKQAIIVQDYRSVLVKSEKISENQTITASIFRQVFPEVPVMVVAILPQLEPARVIGLEQQMTLIQEQWQNADIHTTFDLVIYQDDSVVKMPKRTLPHVQAQQQQNSWAVLTNFIRQGKMTAGLGESLQDIRFCRHMFGVNFPVLMSRSNYLRSHYERQLFSKQVVLIQGKEYFVFIQWQSGSYERFIRWLQSQK